MRLTSSVTVSFGMVLLLVGSAAFAADQCGDADLSKLTTRIYVAPTGSDTPACGASASAPCQSIQQGINRCSGAGCGVLVRYGRYDLTATIQLKDGVSVYGRCVFAGDVDRKYRSTLLAPAGGQPALIAANINTPTWLDGFFMRGSDATAPGSASIVMTVSNSAGLTLNHNQLVSGRGAGGAAGISPGVASAGGPGGWGANAGGGGGPSCSGSADGAGGKGADPQAQSSGGCFLECTCTNWNNSPSQPGKASGAVQGGTQGHDGGKGRGCAGRSSERAGPGQPGQPGATGNCSSRGGQASTNQIGGFDGTRWISAAGGDGGAGNVGSGGGGGGSGGTCAYPTVGGSWRDAYGNPGGGGGGGGCGGDGGKGGQQGGASIPLVLLNASINWSKVSFVPGPGGRGGLGGQGGQGGQGGPGGPGDENYWLFGVCPGPGNKGGAGGSGGAGAGGAGGNGGPSIGIALVGESRPPNDQGIYAGQPGTGGSRGSGGQNDPTQCKGADGVAGVAGGTAAWWQYLLEGYTTCAQEGGTCSFGGTKDVAYGANGRFVYKTATSSIGCNNSTFGDPIGGTVKACYIIN